MEEVNHIDAIVDRVTTITREKTAEASSTLAPAVPSHDAGVRFIADERDGSEPLAREPARETAVLTLRQ